MNPAIGVQHDNCTRFTVPVFPHVKKFVLKNYGSRGKTIKVEEHTVFGKMVNFALRDTRRRSEFFDQYRNRLTESFNIILTAEQSRIGGAKLSKLMRINVDLDRLFKEHLIVWIHAQHVAGISAHPACKSFLTHYDLDENEYSLDAAYQYWKRYLKAEGKKFSATY